MLEPDQQKLKQMLFLYSDVWTHSAPLYTHLKYLKLSVFFCFCFQGG